MIHQKEKGNFPIIIDEEEQINLFLDRQSHQNLQHQQESPINNDNQKHVSDFIYCLGPGNEILSDRCYKGKKSPTYLKSKSLNEQIQYKGKFVVGISDSCSTT